MCPFKREENAVYPIAGCEREPHQKMFANPQRGPRKLMSPAPRKTPNFCVCRLVFCDSPALSFRNWKRRYSLLLITWVTLYLTADKSLIGSNSEHGWLFGTQLQSTTWNLHPWALHTSVRLKMKFRVETDWSWSKDAEISGRQQTPRPASPLHAGSSARRSHEPDWKEAHASMDEFKEQPQSPRGSTRQGLREGGQEHRQCEKHRVTNS